MARIEAPFLEEKEPQTKLALLFPGQGTQRVGMGKELYQRYQSIRQLFQLGSEICGYDLTKICFEGPQEVQDRTENAQVAIFVVNHAYFLALCEAGKLPQNKIALTAGHSLGEYNALVAANAISFEDGLRLVTVRAKSMQHACEMSPSGMLAIMNISSNDLSQVTQKFGLEVSVLNTDDQIVVGGPADRLDEARAWLANKKIKASPLPVAGAFHTTFMAPAVEPLSDVIASIDFKMPQIDVVANTTAQVIKKAQEIPGELISQLTKPVLWKETITSLTKSGIDSTLEIGERGILSNMNKKVIGGVIAGAVMTITGVAAAVLWHHHHQH